MVPQAIYRLLQVHQWIEWVAVPESHPADTITWIFVGSDDPEMEEASD